MPSLLFYLIFFPQYQYLSPKAIVAIILLLWKPSPLCLRKAIQDKMYSRYTQVLGDDRIFFHSSKNYHFQCTYKFSSELIRVVVMNHIRIEHVFKWPLPVLSPHRVNQINWQGTPLKLAKCSSENTYPIVASSTAHYWLGNMNPSVNTFDPLSTFRCERGKFLTSMAMKNQSIWNGFCFEFAKSVFGCTLVYAEQNIYVNIQDST